MEQLVRWHVYRNPLELASRMAGAVVRVSAEAIARQGLFRIVLAGGTAPLELYARLREIGAVSDAWRLYLGDERCRPIGHVDRNDRVVSEVLLGGRELPGRQYFRIPSELGPEAGASAYSGLISEVETFDLVLLGLGEDGHTAGLFPGHNLGETKEAPSALAVNRAPKPPPERVTMSADRLSRAEAVFFIVIGRTKRRAVEAWFRGETIPASFIRPVNGVDVFLDWGALPEKL